MTIIKQKSVSHERHANNLRDYINDKDALLRDGQNLIDEKDWFGEMDDTREAAGHNVASRQGAKNVIMYHQIVAFLPEEADLNGGKMSPEKCMEYARQYAQRRYPNQQIAFALHKEHCKADGTDRYAVHMAINRTDLETGKRLSEGRGEIAKIDRANTMRELDQQWGLQQVEKDKPNSKLHNRQARGAEKEILQRGEKSYKHNLRQWSSHAAQKAESLQQFVKVLEGAGYQIRETKKGIFVIDQDHETNQQGDKITFNLSRLDGHFSKESLEERFADKRVVKAIGTELKQFSLAQQNEAERKEVYRNALMEAYGAYCDAVKIGQRSKEHKEIPAFHPPQIPASLQKDSEIRQMLLDYRNKAENLRNKTGYVPRAGKDRKTGFGTGEELQRNRQEQRQQPEYGKTK